MFVTDLLAGKSSLSNLTLLRYPAGLPCFQPGFNATQVTFTTAVAVQCRRGRRAASDLVQFDITGDRATLSKKSDMCS